MTEPAPKVALLTGCSSGIGRALAVELRARGWRVFATARRVESMADLVPLGIDTLALDVTNDASIGAAVDATVAAAGRIDLVVNNAGFGLMGPASEVPIGEVRRQLETNVIGALAVVQAVVPVLLRQGGGRIVNVGSVAGVLITPFAGVYGASKAAMNALSDALRMELGPLGIDVISLQPGGVVSRFGDTASGLLPTLLRAGSPYSPIAKAIEGRARAGQVGAMDVDVFARRVVDRITAARPPRILRAGKHSVAMPLMRWLLPAVVTDRFLQRRFGLDGLPSRRP